MSRAHEEIWCHSLATLAEREGSLEATPLRGDEDTLDTTYRTRMLSFDAKSGEIIIESISEGSLVTGSDVRLVTQVGPHRCLGVCRVNRYVSFRVNEDTVLEAVALEQAREVSSAQRRSFFRVATAGAPIDPVKICPAGTGDKPVDVALVNISAGGIGVSLAATPELARKLPRSRVYDCTITLPSLDDPITLAARLVHFQLMPKRLLYLGMEFEFKSEKQKREVEDIIARFNAFQQRKQLRRTRGTAG